MQVELGRLLQARKRKERRTAMERRSLLAKLAGIAGAAGALATLRATSLMGQKQSKQSSAQRATTAPCTLPASGQRAGYFPNVVLVNHEWERARFYDDLVRGKIITVNSFSTSKGSALQKQVMTNLVELQKHLGDRVGRDLFMYSITYDPMHDTPQVLHEYAKRLGIRPGWSLLTGRPDDVELVLARIGLGYMRMGDHRMEPHYALLRMGNETLDRWTAMPAVFRPHLLAHHLTLLEVKPERKDPKQFVRGGPFPKDLPESATGRART
jgi:protein SCO1/2